MGGKGKHKVAPVCTTGKAQAKQVAEVLKYLPEMPSVCGIVTSTMQRAKETAAIIHEQFPDLPLEEDTTLRNT